MFGNIMFGFQNPKTLDFVDIDPRFGKLKVVTTGFSMQDRAGVEVQEIEFTSINYRDH